MKKKFKLGAFLFVFAMHSTMMWAAANASTKVTLRYNPGAWLGNNHKPSRLPAKFDIPFTVLLDNEKQQLCVTSQVVGEFTYFIYNENAEIILQGVLNYANYESCTIDLGLCQAGSYSVVFLYNGLSFAGTFEI